MSVMNKISVISVFFGTFIAINTASSAVYINDYEAPGVWDWYNDDAETYSMKFKDDGEKDGFWLVVSDGQNPEGNATEYAVLYGDRTNNRITAYTYDGVNGPESFKNGKHLATYENAFSSAGTHGVYGYEMTMFTLDVDAINSALDSTGWNGVALGEESGIWFHQTSGTDFLYGNDGSIADFDFENQMWFDSGNATSVVLASPDCGASPNNGFCSGTVATNIGGGSVPAPGGLALLLVGLAGLYVRAKSKK